MYLIVKIQSLDDFGARVVGAMKEAQASPERLATTGPDVWCKLFPALAPERMEVRNV